MADADSSMGTRAPVPIPDPFPFDSLLFQELYGVLAAYQSLEELLTYAHTENPAFGLLCVVNRQFEGLMDDLSSAGRA